MHRSQQTQPTRPIATMSISCVRSSESSKRKESPRHLKFSSIGKRNSECSIPFCNLGAVRRGSLARLKDEHCGRDEARGMLAKIYCWFTKGFDTADLKDAKALLEELST